MNEALAYEAGDSGERRTSHRMVAPMTVVIGNTPYAILDWSLSGMRVAGYRGTLRPEDETRVRVLVPTAGPGALFHAKGRVCRYEEDDEVLALSFQAMDPSATSTLNRYYLERIVYGHA